MNILLNPESKAVPCHESAETNSTSTQKKLVKSISFHKCFRCLEGRLKVQNSRLSYSWNQVLSKVPANSQEDRKTPATQVGKNTFERREFPRHASEAIVYVSSDQEKKNPVESDPIGNKGYVINISQNGISFAARLEFQLREELQLQVQDLFAKFMMDVNGSVVRATSLDDQFWRIDCKLLNPLSDQQIVQIKEHASSCYAG